MCNDFIEHPYIQTLRMQMVNSFVCICIVGEQIAVRIEFRLVAGSRCEEAERLLLQMLARNYAHTAVLLVKSFQCHGLGEGGAEANREQTS